MAVHSGRGGWMLFLCLLKVVRFSYKLCKISVLQSFAKKKKKSVFVKTPETILRDVERFTVNWNPCWCLISRFSSFLCCFDSLKYKRGQQSCFCVISFTAFLVKFTF